MKPDGFDDRGAYDLRGSPMFSEPFKVHRTPLAEKIALAALLLSAVPLGLLLRWFGVTEWQINVALLTMFVGVLVWLFFRR